MKEDKEKYIKREDGEGRKLLDHERKAEIIKEKCAKRIVRDKGKAKEIVARSVF